MDEKDCQGAINIIRSEVTALEKRVLAQEIHADHHKQAVTDLKSEFYHMSGSIKLDIERIQVSLHKDIQAIQQSLNQFIKDQLSSDTQMRDSMSQLIREQAVDEAKLQTGVSAGKYFIDKLPLIASVIAAVVGVIVMVKVSGL